MTWDNIFEKFYYCNITNELSFMNEEMLKKEKMYFLYENVERWLSEEDKNLAIQNRKIFEFSALHKEEMHGIILFGSSLENLRLRVIKYIEEYIKI